MTLLRRWLRPAVPAATLHDKVRLCHAYEQLGPRSRRVLLLLADRLVQGQRDYGDFQTPRCWPLERAHEQIDSAVYAAAEYLEQADARGEP